MQHAWGKGMRIGYWWERQKERALGRPRRRWVDKIRMDLGVVGWGRVYWIDEVQDRDRWRALRIRKMLGIVLSSIESVSVARIQVMSGNSPSVQERRGVHKSSNSKMSHCYFSY
jgi:hypothetical protein